MIISNPTGHSCPLHFGHYCVMWGISHKPHFGHYFVAILARLLFNFFYWLDEASYFVPWTLSYYWNTFSHTVHFCFQILTIYVFLVDLIYNWVLLCQYLEKLQKKFLRSQHIVWQCKASNIYAFFNTTNASLWDFGHYFLSNHSGLGFFLL